MSTLAAMSNVADGRRMKSELQELRRRGALRPSASEDCPVGDTRSCNRCRAELGWIVNRGAVCQACRLRVCKACREYTVRTVDWVCTVCYKRSQIQTATGEWMNEYIKKPGGQWKDNKFYMSAADIIKSTIRRSWTICDPNPRWPTSRDSPDFRPYNSLPRGRDVTDFPSLVDNNDKRSISPDTTKKDDYESRSEGYSPKHRRVSQFERTLSELYGSQKKTRRSSTSDDSNGVEKSPNEPTLPPPPPPTNEMNKKTELKPTKIPSPRKKIQYTRSETLVVSSDSPKQQIKKHLSLQTSKKYASKEKLDDSAAIQEKRVSFDDECSKKTMNENICSKSGIPKREIKHRNYNKSETKPESITCQDKIEIEPNIEQQEEQIEINESAVENSVIETVSDDTEKNDLEPLSGAVFRKVTIKRRRHDFKKTQAFDEGVRRKQRYTETARDDLLDLDPGSILLPDCDDYKLVFISSDSSSKEEEIDDNDSVSSSSATTGHSFTIDDCDWDYFEPSSGVKPVLCWSNRNSPFGSPRVYRRGVLDSPIGSPLVYRRARESDTGTDEDVTHSPASSDSTVGFLSRVRSSSETEDHLPMDVGYTENNEQRLQCVMRRGEDTGSNGNTSAAPSQLGTAPVVRSPCQSCGAVTTSPPTQFVPIPVLVPIPVPVPALWNPLDPVILYNTSDILDCNLRARLRAIQQRTGALLLPCVNQASLISSLISAGGDGNSLMSVQHSMYTQTVEAETNMTAAFEQNNARTDEHAAGGERVHEPETNEPGSNADNKRRVTITCDAVNSVNAENIGDTSQLIVDGYLLSENTFNSSTETSDNTDSEDEGVGKPRLHRTYNVNNFRDSDDPLSSNVTSCDEDDTRMSHSSDRHESSSIADTDSDEGTVAEQKAKKFSKVFVVNNNDSSSDVDDYSDSSSTDTSDNDTDTECVVLNYIKPIEDSLYLNNCDNGDDSIVLLKHIKSNEDKFSDDNNGIVLLKHVTFNTSEYKTSAINDCDIDTLDNTSTSEQCNIDSTESELSNHIATDQVEETANVDCTIAVQLTNFELIDCTPTTSEEETKQIDLESNMKLSNVIDTPPIGKQIDIERDICETETLFPQEQKYSEALPSGEWNTNTDLEIRSSDPVRWSRDTNRRGYDEVKGESLYARGARTGAPTAVHRDHETAHHVPAARYTSLVMITQESPPVPPHPGICPQVSIVPSDTTTIIPVANNSDVIVQHTNWQDETSDPEEQERSGLADYFTALDNPNNNKVGTPPRKPVHVTKNSVTVVANSDTLVLRDNVRSDIPNDGVIVVTGGDTLSAVVCLEEGLADDDSWVEDISHDEDEFATTTATDSSSGEEVTLGSSMDQEEELRGYHRTAIDFTLHTIVEESCEESEVEQAPKKRPTSATDLEKYFFYRLGNGSTNNINSQDAFSETSSIYSEGMDSLGAAEEVPNDGIDPAELASSRLEKYFLSGFMGFTSERRDSDGSVGSDSEGRPSPEQRRKKLVRARGTGRSHSSSLDNLLANAELSGNEPQSADIQQNGSEDSSSSETDTYDEPSNFEKSDGQFDTVKRKKCKKQRVVSGGSSSPHEDRKGLETTMEESNENNDSDGDEGHKTPQPEFLLPVADLANSRKQQSRDSGFIGSSDDLLRDQRSHSDSSDAPSTKPLELKNDLEKITEEKRDEKTEKMHYYTGPPTTTLTRKDSFNNWSSDEETNLMMSKMRQFFKTMVANNSNVHLNPSSKPTTPVLGKPNPPRSIPSPRTKRNKPPQLVYFENELTRLMKTVPGIRDDQVREIVEYLSSEDTWSDSYDSSDYTSSDLEGTAVAQKSALQQQISASCQQIINKFDKNAGDEEGDEGDGGILDDSQGLNRETAFVYQKLVASFNKIASGQISDTNSSTPHNSPPLIAKVMHHIGSRLVALMHEVSSGESHCSTSPKVRYHHRRLQQKLSSASTTEDDDSTSDSNLPDRLTGLDETSYNLLPRSRSHDLLLGEARAHHQSSSGVSDIAEEREASDYERFSWRGSFESALMATDSRTKLSMIGTEGSASASALAMAAKRRSAGDLLFSPKSLSREQLDRVRSCGSIGGSGNSEEKHWVVTHAVRPNRRRSSVPDATCGSGGSADGEDDDEEDMESRSTLPRSLQTNTATTNSLPRLPTSSNAANMHKAQSMHHFLQHNVKSARYRPPGFNRSVAGTTGPKRAVSAPGLQPSHPRREARRRSQQPLMSSDDLNINESNASPVVAPKSGSKSVSPSPIHGNTLSRGTGSVSSADWQGNEDDIDRLVAMHHNRSSLSSLGLRSDSMASVYSGAGEGRYGIVAVRGQVEFGLQYNYKAGALEIHIKQCKDLAAVDMKRNRSDPYVKVYLLPDKSKGGKRKTKVKKHTLNPVFDECLKFHSTLSGLETRTLWLTVWHSDMFGRNDFLGEVMMPLENKVFDDPSPKWYNLQERTEPFEELPSYKGDIIVGLKFVPPDMTVQKKGKRSRGALHVLVKEAKSLTAVKANGTSDPFCKSYLLPDKGRSNKQKTPIIRRTTNPTWNHTFVYDDVTLQELTDRALELTVWDHDRLASNEFLGGVRFSLGTSKHYGKNVDWMDATGKELSLWQNMLERPNFWVEGCVTLRPSLDNRCT